MGIRPGKSVTAERILRLLEEILAGDGRVESVADKLGLPQSTAYRQVGALVAEGCLLRMPGGQYIAGPRLLSLFARIDARQIIGNVAQPTLEGLAHSLNAVVQLGTLEQGMVTYRVKAGRSSTSAFTKVGMQMEAYCSAVGKVLLAHLPGEDLETYLAGGPFVPLTEATITDPDRLRAEFKRVLADGFAVDDNEAAEGLYCVAMPLRSPNGAVCASVSVSRSTTNAARQGNAEVLARLAKAVLEIEQALGGRQIRASRTRQGLRTKVRSPSCTQMPT